MKRLLLLSCAALVFLSCYFPPYKEDLSLAIRTADKLDGRAVVGPIDRGPWDFQGRTVVFYPSKDALVIRTNDYVRGFVVATDDHSARMMFVDHGPTEDDDYFIGSENTVPLGNSDDTLFTYSVSPVKDGDDDDGQELLGIVLAADDSNQREFVLLDQVLQVVTPIDMNLELAGHLGLPPPPDTLVIGASFLVENAPDSDLFYGLCIDRIAGLFAEAMYRTNASGGLQFLAPVRPAIAFDLPGLSEELKNVFCFHNVYTPTFRSYLSYYDKVRRSYRNFSWDDSLQLRLLTDMDRRIDLVLSNDWLFSHDGNKGYVYNSDGELLNSFVMGGLTLVYEIYDAGIANVVFTIPVWAPVQVGGNDWQDRMFFLVYWIPTDELAGL